MPKWNEGDFVIFAKGPGGGFRGTIAGKPYEIVNGRNYFDEEGDELRVDGWESEFWFYIDRIITPEQYEAELGASQ